MRIRTRQARLTLTRRDFLGACAYSPALFLPAPFYGAVAAPLPQDARTHVAAVAPLFPEYRIIPQYRARSPLEDLIRKARQNEDDFPSERYSREIEGSFRAMGSRASEEP